LTAGVYEININSASNEFLEFDGINNTIRINANQRIEHEIVLRERYTRFIRFDR
jgi:hypothetical protein